MKKRLHDIQVEGQNVAAIVGARERVAPAAVKPMMDESVVGADIVALLRSTTDALAEAIGAGGKRRASVPGTTALQEALSRFARKVGAYGRLLAAKVDEDDEQSIRRFFDAVAPIDAYRASARGWRGGGRRRRTATQRERDA